MNQTAFRLGLALLFVISLAAVLGTHDSPGYGGEDKLPDMHIDTNGAETIDKDAYVPCTVSVDSSEDSFTDASAGIKGRGNSTWGQPKKPYTLRFDQKTDLFGNGYAKTWVLLANYLDKSMIRNYLSFSAAEALELDYTTSTQFVNLYLNGEYLGVYLVAEKIQIGKDRVDIGVPDDFPENEENFSFILEMDSHAAESGEEGIDYFTLNGRYYVIKDPDCTPMQVEMIKRFTAGVWEAVGSGDWEKVCECLDADSFASTYIVEELFHDADVDLTSFYLHRGPDNKLRSGPVWDFDLCAGNYNTSSVNDPDKLYASWKSIWYSSLFGYKEFRDLVSDKLAEKESAIRAALENGWDYVNRHGGDFARNYERWNTLDKQVPMNPFVLMTLDTWQEHAEHTMSWLYRSLDTLMREYCR